MSLSIGIVGLPNVGKSTLFKALTKKEVEIANYPFATIDPNVGVVEVPDERLGKLSELSHSKQIVPTVIEFLDIAGLVKGANKGEGLGNQFLATIREVDAVLYVIRTFELADIHHVEKTINPMRDVEILRTELALKDLEVIQKRFDSIEGKAKTGDKDAKEELEIVSRLKDALNNGTHVIEFIKNSELSPKSLEIIKGLQLLTSKPYFFLLNSRGDDVPPKLVEYISELGSQYVSANAREELDTADFSNDQRAELNLGQSKLAELIQAGYKVLNLITFFTTGEDETRAWTCREGSTAPEAAGKIHNDFKDKFIRAEVIAWDKLLEAGGWAQARSKGLIRTEGKEYVVKDGDTLVILHNA
ncbi:MAG: redox-regulated ATPase YchF [Candidatus Spechtbacteria bacterium RIFCSPLOWO2_01_FULL_43_12]|uniref:Ribosome-binding ATPase YchF n=1 Tax=Candidatus Spechtbacteria bacterium RIFCSPLOWO2_01_FULL_43_12 TaxID=1802162 RepID=A0A1G2HG07_9BACT|nr:MAG: redox-regulated ATPase YchF [Candidatus Spechtbacteria bacterium RIFCSPLOWO2_01_FULL_43_12]